MLTPLPTTATNDDRGFAVEYWDYRFNTLASKVGYGRVRFPGGSEGDIYNRQTGEAEAGWFTPFANLTAGPQQGEILSVFGKGGARLIDAVSLSASWLRMSRRTTYLWERGKWRTRRAFSPAFAHRDRIPRQDEAISQCHQSRRSEGRGRGFRPGSRQWGRTEFVGSGHCRVP